MIDSGCVVVSGLLCADGGYRHWLWSCAVLVLSFFFFFLMIRRPPRSTLDRSSAASDVYKRQAIIFALNPELDV